MAIKKTDLSVPAGGSYRQFGYTPPNDSQKKSLKSKKNDAPAAEEENNTPGMTSAISSIAGAHNQINTNISQSGNINKNAISTVNAGGAKKTGKVVQAYENNQYNPQKIALEEDLDKLVKQLIPELGVKFKVQENGQIIASVINNATKETVREFPADKMFDIIHSMSQKLGTVAKIKI